MADPVGIDLAGMESTVCGNVPTIPDVNPDDGLVTGREIYNTLFPDSACTLSVTPSMGGGKKSSRIKGRRKKQQRHRLQHGGVVGRYMTEWVTCASRIICELDIPNSTKNRMLSFYQLIIFTDIAKLLQKDLVQLNTRDCETIAKCICKHLDNADILGAYLTSVFTSAPNTSLFLAGASLAAGASIYVAGSCLPAYTMALTYINSFSEFTFPYYIEAIITVISTVWAWTGGILITAHTPTHFFGVMNFGVLIHKRFYKHIYTPPRFDNPPITTIRQIPKKIGTAAINLALEFVSWQGVMNQISGYSRLCLKTYKIAINMPSAVRSCINAAKRYKDLSTFSAARTAASNDCDKVAGVILDTLSTDPDYTPEQMHFFLEKFEIILTEIGHGDTVRQIEVLHDQISTADTQELQDIAQIASPPDWRKEHHAAWVAAKKAAEDRMVARLKERAEEAQKKRKEEEEKQEKERDEARAKERERMRSGYRPPDNDMGRSNDSSSSRSGDRGNDRRPRGDDRGPRDDGRGSRDGRGYSGPRGDGYGPRGDGYGSSRPRDDWPGSRSGYGDGSGSGSRRYGGSSKHKKKHPRPTNKRKPLTRRMHRRRTMRNKKR